MRRIISSSTVVVVAAAPFLMVGCSGDDSPDADSSSPSAASQATEAGSDEDAATPRNCYVKAELGGAEKLDIAGDGQFIAPSDETQPGVYMFEVEGARLTVFSAGGDIDDALTMSVGKANYSSKSAEGVDVEPAGDGVMLTDAVVSDADENQVTVSGQIACGKAGKQLKRG